jgi:hypothetical protein
MTSSGEVHVRVVVKTYGDGSRWVEVSSDDVVFFCTQLANFTTDLPHERGRNETFRLGTAVVKTFREKSGL